MERAAIHDFNNLLQELVFAVRLRQGEHVDYYVEQLRERYRAAVKR